MVLELKITTFEEFWLKKIWSCHVSFPQDAVRDTKVIKTFTVPKRIYNEMATHTNAHTQISLLDSGWGANLNMFHFGK